LATVNERLTARLAEVEARLAAPPKTPDNSSTPPSRGLKANRRLVSYAAYAQISGQQYISR